MLGGHDVLRRPQIVTLAVDDGQLYLVWAGGVDYSSPLDIDWQYPVTLMGWGRLDGRAYDCGGLAVPARVLARLGLRPVLSTEAH